ncbi:hypothetical protein APHAL10511_004247 [Amanita phalloides]|nr:hypothetical protein APHAL10511_004247 [Amanita phalloides]
MDSASSSDEYMNQDQEDALNNEEEEEEMEMEVGSEVKKTKKKKQDDHTVITGLRTTRPVSGTLAISQDKEKGSQMGKQNNNTVPSGLLPGWDKNTPVKKKGNGAQDEHNVNDQSIVGYCGLVPDNESNKVKQRVAKTKNVKIIEDEDIESWIHAHSRIY